MVELVNEKQKYSEKKKSDDKLKISDDAFVMLCEMTQMMMKTRLISREALS